MALQKLGAYGKFKNLLEHRAMLETWYAHEAASVRRELQYWLADESIAYTQEQKP